MNPKNTKSLLWIGIISMLTGMIVMSPVAGLALYALATVFSAFPALLGAKRVRIIGIMLLVLSLFLSVATYPKYVAEMTSYKKRANKAVEKKPAATTDKSVKTP